MSLSADNDQGPWARHQPHPRALPVRPEGLSASGEDPHLHVGALLLQHLDLDPRGRQLHAVLRVVGEPVGLGVVEQRLGRLSADVARLRSDVQRERVRLLQPERRVVALDRGAPRLALRL